MAIVLNIHAIYRHRLRRDLANGAAILLRPFSDNTLISLSSHLCKKMTPTPVSGQGSWSIVSASNNLIVGFTNTFPFEAIMIPPVHPIVCLLWRTPEWIFPVFDFPYSYTRLSMVDN